MPRPWSYLLVMLSVIASPCTAAANRNADPGHDQVEFTVEAGAELANDLAEVVLAAQAEDHDPARVAGEINAAMSWALNRVHGVADIAATSGGYQTYPVYDKTRLDQWRGSQTLVLRSKRIEALNTLVGSLQQRLQVQNMRFTVSPDQRQASESRLIDQALERFKARALRIQQRLGAAGYDIVHLTVDTSGHPPPRPLATMAMARAASRPALAGEAGTSRQILRIHAVIQLRF